MEKFESVFEYASAPGRVLKKILSANSSRNERCSEVGVHEQTDLYELWTIHFITRKFFFDAVENGPIEVAPIV